MITCIVLYLAWFSFTTLFRFTASVTPLYILSLWLNGKGKFYLSFGYKYNSHAWHVTQPAISVYSLLSLGWGKHFHPHRLPPTFYEWNWRQSLSSQLSLIETHWLGTVNMVYCTELFEEGIWAYSDCLMLTVERYLGFVQKLRLDQMRWDFYLIKWDSCMHVSWHLDSPLDFNKFGTYAFCLFLGWWNVLIFN